MTLHGDLKTLVQGSGSRAAGYGRFLFLGPAAPPESCTPIWSVSVTLVLHDPVAAGVVANRAAKRCKLGHGAMVGIRGATTWSFIRILVPA